MASKPSEKCRYQSRFGGGWIPAANYLAESMCDRQARRKAVSLPQKFWNTEAWKREFLLQLRHANGLLRLYSPEAVIRALREPDGKNIFSLGAPWLDGLVAQQQEQLDRRAANLAASEPPPPAAPQTTVETPRPAYKPNPSLLNKLRGLDGEVEG